MENNDRHLLNYVYGSNRSNQYDDNQNAERDSVNFVNNDRLEFADPHFVDSFSNANINVRKQINQGTINRILDNLSEDNLEDKQRRLYYSLRNKGEKIQGITPVKGTLNGANLSIYKEVDGIYSNTSFDNVVLEDIYRYSFEPKNDEERIRELNNVAKFLKKNKNEVTIYDVDYYKNHKENLITFYATQGRYGKREDGSYKGTLGWNGAIPVKQLDETGNLKTTEDTELEVKGLDERDKSRSLPLSTKGQDIKDLITFADRTLVDHDKLIQYYLNGVNPETLSTKDRQDLADNVELYDRLITNAREFYKNSKYTYAEEEFLDRGTNDLLSQRLGNVDLDLQYLGATQGKGTIYARLINPYTGEDVFKTLGTNQDFNGNLSYDDISKHEHNKELVEKQKYIETNSSNASLLDRTKAGLEKTKLNYYTQSKENNKWYNKPLGFLIDSYDYFFTDDNMKAKNLAKLNPTAMVEAINKNNSVYTGDMLKTAEDVSSAVNLWKNGEYLNAIRNLTPQVLNVIADSSGSVVTAIAAEVSTAVLLSVLSSATTAGVGSAMALISSGKRIGKVIDTTLGKYKDILHPLENVIKTDLQSLGNGFKFSGTMESLGKNLNKLDKGSDEYARTLELMDKLSKIEKTISSGNLTKKAKPILGNAMSLGIMTEANMLEEVAGIEQEYYEKHGKTMPEELKKEAMNAVYMASLLSAVADKALLSSFKPIKFKDKKDLAIKEASNIALQGASEFGNEAIMEQISNQIVNGDPLKDGWDLDIFKNPEAMVAGTLGAMSGATTGVAGTVIGAIPKTIGTIKKGKEKVEEFVNSHKREVNANEFELSSPIATKAESIDPSNFMDVKHTEDNYAEAYKNLKDKDLTETTKENDEAVKLFIDSFKTYNDIPITYTTNPVSREESQKLLNINTLDSLYSVSKKDLNETYKKQIENAIEENFGLTLDEYLEYNYAKAKDVKSKERIESIYRNLSDNTDIDSIVDNIKTMKDVEKEVSTGDRGFLTYKTKINTLKNLLKRKDLTAEERTNISSELQETTENLNRLYSSQVRKVQQQAKAIKFSKNNLAKYKKYPNRKDSKEFVTLNLKDLLGVGAFGKVTEQNLKGSSKLLYATVKNIVRMSNLMDSKQKAEAFNYITSLLDEVDNYLTKNKRRKIDRKAFFESFKSYINNDELSTFIEESKEPLVDNNDTVLKDEPVKETETETIDDDEILYEPIEEETKEESIEDVKEESIEEVKDEIKEDETIKESIDEETKDEVKEETKEEPIDETKSTKEVEPVEEIKEDKPVEESKDNNVEESKVNDAPVSLNEDTVYIDDEYASKAIETENGLEFVVTDVITEEEAKDSVNASDIKNIETEKEPIIDKIKRTATPINNDTNDKSSKAIEAKLRNKKEMKSFKDDYIFKTNVNNLTKLYDVDGEGLGYEDPSHYMGNKLDEYEKSIKFATKDHIIKDGVEYIIESFKDKNGKVRHGTNIKVEEDDVELNVAGYANFTFYNFKKLYNIDSDSVEEKDTKVKIVMNNLIDINKKIVEETEVNKGTKEFLRTDEFKALIKAKEDLQKELSSLVANDQRLLNINNVKELMKSRVDYDKDNELHDFYSKHNVYRIRNYVSDIERLVSFVKEGNINDFKYDAEHVNDFLQDESYLASTILENLKQEAKRVITKEKAVKVLKDEYFSRLKEQVDDKIATDLAWNKLYKEYKETHKDNYDKKEFRAFAKPRIEEEKKNFKGKYDSKKHYLRYFNSFDLKEYINNNIDSVNVNVSENEIDKYVSDSVDKLNSKKIKSTINALSRSNRLENVSDFIMDIINSNVIPLDRDSITKLTQYVNAVNTNEKEWLSLNKDNVIVLFKDIKESLLNKLDDVFSTEEFKVIEAKKEHLDIKANRVKNENSQVKKFVSTKAHNTRIKDLIVKDNITEKYTPVNSNKIKDSDYSTFKANLMSLALTLDSEENIKNDNPNMLGSSKVNRESSDYESIKNTFDKLYAIKHKTLKYLTKDVINNSLFGREYKDVFKANEIDLGTGLLFNIKFNTETKEVALDYNDQVMLAIDYVVTDYLANYGYELNNDPDDALSDVRGLGISRAIIAPRLGNMVLNTLGFNKDSVSKEELTNLATSVGLLAIKYANQKGFVGITKVTTKRKISIARDIYDTTTNYYVSNKINSKVRDMLKIKHNIFNVNRATSREPVRTETTKEFIRSSKDNSIKAELSTSQKETLKRIVNKEYYIDTRVLDIMQDNADTVFEINKNRNLTSGNKKVNIEGQEFTNIISKEEFLKQIDLLREQAKENKPVYFNAKIASNNRIIYEGLLNPQSNKLFRFLFIPNDLKNTYDKNNEYHMKHFYMGILQGFGISTDKISDSTITNLGKALVDNYGKMLTNNISEVISTDLDLSLDVDGKTYELEKGEMTHYIQALLAIKDYLNSDGDTFQATLLVENDSTASGVFILNLLHYLDGNLGGIGSSTGLYTDDNINKGQRVEQGTNKDIYIESLEGMVDWDSYDSNLIAANAEQMYNDKDKSFEAVLNRGFSRIEETGSSRVADILNKIKPILPGKDKDGNVSKDLRNLAKVMNMVYNYQSGMKSAVKKASEDLFDIILDNFFKEFKKSNNTYKTLTKKDNENIEAFFRLMDEFPISIETYYTHDSKTYEEAELKQLTEWLEADKLYNGNKALNIDKNTLIDLFNNDIEKYNRVKAYLTLQFKKTTDILINDRQFKTLTLQEAFDSSVGFAFSSNLWNSVESKFKTTRTIQAMYSKAYSWLGETYANMLSHKKYSKLNKEQRKELVRTLKEEGLDPSARLNGHDTRVLTLLEEDPTNLNYEDKEKTTKAVNQTYTSNKQMRVHKLDLDSITVETPSFKGLSTSTIAPVLVHSIDSYVISSLENKYDDITTVHDAVVSHALHSDDKVKDYNKNLFDYIQSLDFRKNIIEDVETFFKNMRNVVKNNPDFKSIANNFIRDNRKVKLTVTELNAIKQVFFNKELSDNSDKVEREYKFLTSGMFEHTISDGEHKYYEVDIARYLDMLKVLDEALNVSKDKLLEKENIYIGNMDGSIESVYRVFKGEEADNDKLHDYLSYIENNDYTDIKFTELQANPNNRLKVLDDLIKVSNLTEEQSYNLRNVMKELTNLRLNDLTIKLVDTVDTVSEYNNLDYSIAINTKKRKGTPSWYSNATRYVHELVHASVAPAIYNAKKFSLEPKVNQLLYLYNEASKVIKPEDFLYKNNHKEAVELWNYIFNRKTKDDMLTGLNEFVAYALTDERVAKKLENIPLRPDVAETSWLNTILNFFKQVIRILTPGNKELNKISNPLLDFKDKNIKEAVFRLVNEVQMADTKMLLNMSKKSEEKLFANLVNLFKDSPVKVIEKSAYNLYKAIVNLDNKTLADRTIKQLEAFENLYNKKSIPARLKAIALFAKAFSLMFISPTSRRILPNLMSNILGEAIPVFKEYAFLGRIVHELGSPSRLSTLVDMAGKKARKIEQLAKTTESVVVNRLEEAFSKELKDEEKALLSKLITLDIQSIDLDFDTLKKIALDKTVLQDRINNFKSQIKGRLTLQDYNYVINASKLLSNYLVNRESSAIIASNAEDILKAVNISADNELVALVDEFITLNAMNITPEEELKTLFNLGDEGLKTFIDQHKGYIKQNKERREILGYNDTTRTKGFIKPIKDNNRKVMISESKNEATLKSYGFVRVGSTFGNLGVYVDGMDYSTHRNGSALIYKGKDIIGNSINTPFESYDELLKVNNDVTNKQKIKATKDRLFRLDFLAKKELAKKELDLDSLTRLPIYKDGKGYLKINDYNNTDEFRIMIPNDILNELGYVNNGIATLAYMEGNLINKIAGYEHNKEIFRLLEEEDVKDYTKKYNNVQESFIKHASNTWYDLSAFENNKFVSEEVKNFDEQMKKMLTSFQRRHGRNLRVRGDVLLDLVGQKDLNVLDRFNNRPIITFKVNGKERVVSARTLVQTALTIFKSLATTYRSLIVIKTPAVLIGNIISNLVLHMMNGMYNPAEIIKGYINAYKSTEDYLRTYNEIIRTEMDIKSGAKGKGVLHRNLNNKLELNPLHTLMSAGLLQNIVDDIDVVNRDDSYSLDNVLDKIRKKTPKPVGMALDWLYMSKNTATYRAMEKVILYSDFLARVVEYNYRYAELKSRIKDINSDEFKKEHFNIIADITYMFVNYDKPQSSGLQFLQDIGLVNFVKFFKRIQHVTFRFATEHPVKLGGLLATQFMIGDVPDIMDTNILVNHDLTKYMYNPLFTIDNYIIPPYLQYILNIK